MFGVKIDLKHYEESVVHYESAPIQKGRILFYGHSLFTRCQPDNKWQNPNIEEHILTKDGTPCVLNHGLGGCCADDLLYFYNRMVRPYEPRVLVLAIGGNDILKGYSATEIIESFARVVDFARADFPGIPIYILSSCYGSRYKDPALQNLVVRRKEFDGYLEVYAKTNGYNFVDMHLAPFFYENDSDIGIIGKVREDIFCEDKGHFNEKGYYLFFDFIKEVLSEHL